MNASHLRPSQIMENVYEGLLACEKRPDFKFYKDATGYFWGSSIVGDLSTCAAHAIAGKAFKRLSDIIERQSYLMKYLLLFIHGMLSFLGSHSQSHPMTDSEKENYLFAIWHKDVRHFYVGDSLTGNLILTLVMPDSQMTNVTSDTSGYAFGFAAVYNSFILKPHRIRQDSVTVLFYKKSDTLTPFYTVVVHLNLIRYNDQTNAAMSQALLFLCPDAKYCYVAGDELCEVFETSKTLDSNYMRKYATVLTGITAKYVWKNSERIQRIVFVWIDKTGMPHPILFSIKSKEYEKAVKWL